MILKQILEKHKLWLEGDPNGERADLKGANLLWADLREANLRGADLREANLRWADLREANLREANLREADLRWANLKGADLREADPRGADLRGANLQGADLRRTNVLQFQYNKHQAISTVTHISIGCLFNTVEWWLENYKEVGKEHGYTEDEIEEYGDFVKKVKKNLTNKVNRGII